MYRCRAKRGDGIIRPSSFCSSGAPSIKATGTARKKSPVIIPRSEHSVSRKQISENALKVLYRLHKTGHQAFLVGGSVRDLLLGLHPKDFDVATDARPEDVRRLFRNCRLIGRRFRLAHIHFGRDVIEVATFRAAHREEEDDDAVVKDDSGRIIRDNRYGNIDEDIWRRDFTANSLYYDIKDFSIWDYAGGVRDIKNRVLRLIGDAETRYREDPVRMLRAVRFAAKLGFDIHKDSRTPIPGYSQLLSSVPAARLFEEMLKMFLAGFALPSFELLRELELFRYMFPMTDACLNHPRSKSYRRLVEKALQSTDKRIRNDLPVTPAFLLAVFLWQSIRERASKLERDGLARMPALQMATSDIVQEQQGYISLPRRFTTTLRDIVTLQPRFEYRVGKRALRLSGHPRFRAAYDFFELRADAGEIDADLFAWWLSVQGMGDEQRRKALMPKRRAHKRRGGRRRRLPAKPANETS